MTKLKHIPNPLSVTHPDLVKEWDYEKNASLTPEQVSAGSDKKVWWRCKLGHSFDMTIYKRTKDNCGCYYCCVPAKRVLKGFNDLATKHPALAKQWHPTKNENLKPDMVLCASHKKVWWKCDKGHEWPAVISSRTKPDGYGCPICSGQRILIGFNDLPTVKPELIKEWDFEKNGDLKPTDVTISSGRNIWWKCESGHSWRATVANRSKGSGCRVCQRESRTSFPEQAIFYYIRQKFNDAENGNISVLDGKELDIYIPSKKIAIEFDGSTWHKDQSRDEDKNKACIEKGIVLYRVRDHACPKLKYNAFVYEIGLSSYKDDDIEKAIICLFELLEIKIDININRDRAAILGQYINTKKESSIANTDLVAEWNYDKNEGVSPENVYIHARRKYWWKCNKGHEWPASPDNRAKGKNCPYCSGRYVIKGENDLLTIRPDLVEEWDFEKNGDLDPSEIKPIVATYVWWKCKVCAHEWRARVSNRYYGKGCPLCGRIKNVESRIRKVMNIDTGDVYDNAKSAAKALGIKSAGNIRSCCNGYQKTAGGYHWKYFD